MLIKISIEGVSPLLCNRFHEAAQQKVESGNSAVFVGSKGSPRDQAEAKLYRDSTGHCVVPGPNLFSAIIEAGKYIKAGKSKLSTNRSSIIPAGLSVDQIELPILPGKWEVDSRAVVIPSTGGRIMCHRPRFDEWRLHASLVIDDSMFGEKVVRELVDFAGSRVGLGDFRPQRRGPFGRFKVVSWRSA
ncbi:MAG: hypothetical protein ACT4PG_09940 [Panacagrimonas sp.]